MAKSGAKVDRCKAVVYYRVSTDKQGKSKLGLEAQETAVKAWLASNQCKMVASYSEVESGKLSNLDRPQLDMALTHTRKVGGVLVVAKLDRLYRNVRFLLTLIDGMGQGSVVFCDLPSIPIGPIGRFMIISMANAAELERGLISERTKAALTALKARGVKLGRNNLTTEGMERGRRLGGLAVQEQAVEAYEEIIPLIRSLRAESMPLQAIAARLNADGHTTRQGKPFGQVQVMRILNRPEAE